MILTELESAGAVQTSYVRAGLDALEQTTGGLTQVLMRDGQGNTRALLNPSTNTISERYSYDAFGSLRSSPTNPATSQRYTGQQYDQASGLYQMRARYYNPVDGRFLSRDPYAMGAAHSSQHNRYVYGANNPVNGFDPSGELFIEMVGESKTNEEQRKKHINYHAGTGSSTGLDRGALWIDSILSAVFDSIFVTGSWALFSAFERFNGIVPDDRGSIHNIATLSLGTVHHLGGSTKRPPNTVTKAVTINAAPSTGICQWSGVGRNICKGIPKPGQYLKGIIEQVLSVMIQPVMPGSNVAVIEDVNEGENKYDSFMDVIAGGPWKYGHAEILIARWALANFDGPPTPHRVLDIVSSRSACESTKYGRLGGFLPCELALYEVKALPTYLFETSIFINLPFK